MCGLVGAPGLFEDGERMLATLRWAAGAERLDMVLHLREKTAMTQLVIGSLLWFC